MSVQHCISIETEIETSRYWIDRSSVKNLTRSHRAVRRLPRLDIKLAADL